MYIWLKKKSIKYIIKSLILICLDPICGFTPAIISFHRLNHWSVGGVVLIVKLKLMLPQASTKLAKQYLKFYLYSWRLVYRATLTSCFIDYYVIALLVCKKSVLLFKLINIQLLLGCISWYQKKDFAIMTIDINLITKALW